MPRSYQPDLQARQSRRIRNHSHPSWDGFHRFWTAFNALYNAAAGRTERDRVRAAVKAFLSDDRAAELLAQLTPPQASLPDPPPGDTRYREDDQRFRQASLREAQLVADDREPSASRLAALMVLVYQVRCSLVHGNKSPDRRRADKLVKWGLSVLQLVVPALEEAMLRVA